MFQEVRAISAKKHLPFKQRMALLWFFVRLRLTRFFANRLFAESKIKTVRGLGYTFHLNTFSEFYWTFKEVFIEEEYYFTTNRNDPVVLDCGGHIGLATLYFKWLYKGAHVTVFEPLPENFSILKQNIDANKLTEVTALQKAVAATAGQVTFEGSGRAGHITEADAPDSITVETVKLSDFVAGEIDLCKMDIEGAEAAVINELSEANKLSKINKLVMEYHLQPGNSLGNLITNFENSGFKVSFNSTLDPLRHSERNFTHIMLVAIKAQ